ncbi:MAG: sugar transferase [Acidobacteria bacterium]|jgi:exopolysaccharide biosynthesis polyprenyl glycosylphosphotransferase|nr:sugar transferase [Acidobacteriota bacterium]
MKAETAVKPKIEFVKTENRVPRYVMPLVKALIFLADAGLAIASFTLAFIWREGDAIFSQTAWAWSKEFEPYAGVLLFVVPIRLAMLVFQRVYRLHGAFSYINEFIKIFKAVSVGSLLIIAFTFLFRGGFAFRDFSYSRGVFALDFIISLVIFSAFHLGLRRLQTLVRAKDINLIPTLIVGTNAEAEQTIRELQERTDLGYRVVGVIESELRITNYELQEKTAEILEIQNPKSKIQNPTVPIVGTLDDLPDVIRELAIQEVIITDSRVPSEKLFEAMIQIGREQKVEFRLAPSMFNFLPQKTSVEQIGVLPMVRLFREPLSDAERFTKRAFDILISAILLVLLSPVWIVISILIKLDSRGSVLFKQERVGMDGRKFLCYKFRTMKTDADEELHREAYRKNIEGSREANAGDEEKPVFGKVKNDPRVTHFGRFLRRTSLDELPQFLNVLIGDMSIVGARPPIPYEVKDYDLKHRKRLDMKPGITGLWQVSGRNRLTFEEMVQIDLYYIENWSLWLDLKIILLTLPAILRGDGAR